MNSLSDEIAAYMLAELEKAGELYQDDIADRIASRFGGASTYENENGNLAIGKDILAAFHRLTGDNVVWVRSDRYWRKRQHGDAPGRQQ